MSKVVSIVTIAFTFALSAVVFQNCASDLPANIDLSSKGVLELNSTSPTNIAIPENDPLQIVVSASGGTEPYNYKWEKSGLKISAEANYSKSLASSFDSGTYIATVTDANEKTASMEFQVTVEDLPLVPKAQFTTNLNPEYSQDWGTSPVSLFVVVQSNSTPSYQWYKSPSQLLLGKTDPVLTLPGNNVESYGSYFVKVTNLGGTVDSSVAKVTLNTVCGDKKVEGHELCDCGTTGNKSWCGDSYDLSGDNRVRLACSSTCDKVGAYVYMNSYSANYTDSLFKTTGYSAIDGMRTGNGSKDQFYLKIQCLEGLVVKSISNTICDGFGDETPRFHSGAKNNPTAIMTCTDPKVGTNNGTYGFLCGKP